MRLAPEGFEMRRAPCARRGDARHVAVADFVSNGVSFKGQAVGQVTVAVQGDCITLLLHLIKQCIYTEGDR
jgi:hypothetical protein